MNSGDGMPCLVKQHSRTSSSNKICSLHSKEKQFQNTLWVVFIFIPFSIINNKPNVEKTKFEAIKIKHSKRSVYYAHLITYNGI